jgi:hypothetical protein
VFNGAVGTGRKFVEFGLREGREMLASSWGGSGGGGRRTAEIKKKFETR